MITLICGGRNFTGHYKFDEAMKLLPFKPTLIVHGGANGADTLADGWAKHHGIYPVRIDPLWGFYGNPAGSKRNQAMLDIMNIQYCIAFPGGTGTADMIKRCINENITVWEPYKPCIA